MPYAGLSDELISRGYVVKQLPIGQGYKQYIAPNGKVAITKARLYEYPFISRITKTISQDKELSYAFARLLDVVVPETLRTTSFEQANAFLAKYGRVITKPTKLGGSKGITLNITRPEQLNEAILHATFDDEPPLIQEQFVGEEVRFTVIRGKVHSVVLRQTPRVVGDGQKTVAELIKAENKARESLVFPLRTYAQLSSEIIPEHFITDSRVLAESEVQELSLATSFATGASFYGVLNTTHASYIEIAERLAARLNPHFLVVDLMINNRQSPAAPGNYIFLEFNTAPTLAVYTSLRDGDTPDVIAKIADLIDEYS